jgi:hypothetical protein
VFGWETVFCTVSKIFDAGVCFIGSQENVSFARAFIPLLPDQLHVEHISTHRPITACALHQPIHLRV